MCPGLDPEVRLDHLKKETIPYLRLVQVLKEVDHETNIVKKKTFIIRLAVPGLEEYPILGAFRAISISKSRFSDLSV